MGDNWEIIGETGLQFFGKMSASISHEIKNVLAVINENAGLLEDLTLMEKKGVPLDPERIRALAEKIKAQIGRADRIITNMNRLAHSVDEFDGHIDVNELLELLAALSLRFASMRGVTLGLEPVSGPVIIPCNPFLLENLVWSCLDFAMDIAGEGKNIGLAAEKREKGVLIRLTGLGGLKEGAVRAFPGEREKALLAALRAELEVNKEDGELVIMLHPEGAQ